MTFEGDFWPGIIVCALVVALLVGIVVTSLDGDAQRQACESDGGRYECRELHGMTWKADPVTINDCQCVARQEVR